MKKLVMSMATLVLLSTISLQAKVGANSYFNTKSSSTPHTYMVESKVSTVKHHEEESDDKSIYARVTVYWKSGGDSDYYTRKGMTSSGLPLIDHCSVAVDPNLIPFGTELKIPGYGTAKAVDTGSDVISRKASHRTAPVIDLYFDRREEAENWTRTHSEYSNVTIL